MISDQSLAQSQSSRRGRFLQRLRDDVFGTNKNASSSRQNSQTGRTPTPINNGKSGSSQSKYPSRNYSNNSRPAASPTSVSKKNGFGFNVAVNDKDQLYVSRVDRNGNAANAGIRRGDRVKEIGGIESSTVEEFDEIAKIMSAGDQMEFKINRSGKDQKVMVQYGELPKPDPEQLKAAAQKSAAQKSNASSSAASRRYDFAPPANSNLKSVLSGQPKYNQRTSNNQRTTAQPVSQRFTDQIDPKQIDMMKQTIDQQNRQIQQLQQEIYRLRRTKRSR